MPYEYIYEHRPDGEYMRHGDGQNWPAYFGPLLCASYYHDGYLFANYLKKPGTAYPVVYGFLTHDPGDKERIRDDKIFEFLWRDRTSSRPSHRASAFPLLRVSIRMDAGAYRLGR